MKRPWLNSAQPWEAGKRVEVYSRLSRIGRLLFQQGLVSISAGNLSLRMGDMFYISASGSFLGDLKRNDIVKMQLRDSFKITTGGLDQSSPSVEEVVHRSLYLNTSKKAVVHVHPPAALSLSRNRKEIVPSDAEGQIYLKQVPVIEVRNSVSSPEVAQKLPRILEKVPAVIIRNHGVFAAAETPEKAASYVSTLEFSCRIILAGKILDLEKRFN